jgi:hypothetical protein
MGLRSTYREGADKRRSTGLPLSASLTRRLIREAINREIRASIDGFFELWKPASARESRREYRFEVTLDLFLCGIEFLIGEPVRFGNADEVDQVIEVSLDEVLESLGSNPDALAQLLEFLLRYDIVCSSFFVRNYEAFLVLFLFLGRRTLVAAAFVVVLVFFSIGLTGVGRTRRSGWKIFVVIVRIDDDRLL